MILSRIQTAGWEFLFWPKRRFETFNLDHNSWLIARGNLAGIQILLQEGRIWMTQEGDPRDIVLVPGQQYIIQKRGLVIIQGLTEAKILVTLPSNRIFFYLELSRTRRIFL